MFGTNNNEEAILYYLYMMADGEVTYSEEKIFDKICEELRIDAETKKEVVQKSVQLASDSKEIFDCIIKERIDAQVEQNLFGVKKDESNLARIIWNLINLGYADSDYSEEEKKIVNYLITRWSVKEEVYQEFIDTAETLLALEQHKEWIVQTVPRGCVRDNKEKDVDSEMQMLLNDVKLTIDELTM